MWYWPLWHMSFGWHFFVIVSLGKRLNSLSPPPPPTQTQKSSSLQAHFNDTWMSLSVSTWLVSKLLFLHRLWSWGRIWLWCDYKYPYILIMGHFLLLTRMTCGSKVLIRQQKLFHIHAFTDSSLIPCVVPFYRQEVFTRSVARQALQGVILTSSVPEPSS